MRAFELNEEPQGPTLEAAWPQIAQQCSKAVELYKHGHDFLYRGVVSARADVFRETSRNNRRPRNTDQERHRLVDYWLVKHGFKAIRSNSVFASGNKEAAKMYSTNGERDLYVIFPENSAAITWSPKIVDLWHNLPDKMKWAMYRYQNPKAFPEDSYEKFVERVMKNAGYQDHLTPEAISSGKEVMISGAFWGVRYPLIEEIKDKLK